MDRTRIQYIHILDLFSMHTCKALCWFYQSIKYTIFIILRSWHTFVKMWSLSQKTHGISTLNLSNLHVITYSIFSLMIITFLAQSFTFKSAYVYCSCIHRILFVVISWSYDVQFTLLSLHKMYFNWYSFHLYSNCRRLNHAEFCDIVFCIKACQCVNTMWVMCLICFAIKYLVNKQCSKITQNRVCELCFHFWKLTCSCAQVYHK